MSSNEHTLVAVHREGDRCNLAEVDASALQDVRPVDTEGDAVLHAYVTPADIVRGAALTATGNDARILVCVCRTYNTKAAFAALLDRADCNSVSPTPQSIFANR
jgi:hypothetical protein